jgi:hypothetical protein
MPRTPKYPVPQYLVGTTSQEDFDTFLTNKAANILKKDKRRKRPCCRGATLGTYKQKLYDAICAGSLIDPFTGDPLAWDKIHQWNSEIDKGRGGFEKQFYLLPTVDHRDPLSEIIDFEICSWIVNSCKSDQTPEEFLAMCETVVTHCRALSEVEGRPVSVLNPSTPKPLNFSTSDVSAYPKGYQPFSSPQRYFLPSYLNGICTEDQFRKWFFKRAYELHLRDLLQGRPYAVRGDRAPYTKGIYAAALNAGLLDPYTGERMAWEKISTWNSTKGKDWPDDLIETFYLLPTVDHIDPSASVLQFQICSWRINECKSGLTPDEFVGLCRKVCQFRSAS